MVLLLIRAGANVHSPKSTDGNIHSAILLKKPNMLALLLSAGANPNALSSEGKKPLEYAMGYYSENLEMVKILLQAGADPNALTKYDTIFGDAVMSSNEIAKPLINNGFNVNGHSTNGTSHLHSACSCSSEEVVQLLLDKGADINFMGGIYQSTPLLFGIWNIRLSDTFLLKLIPQIKNIEEKWKYHYKGSQPEGTYLENACRHKRKSIIPVLLERGANLKNISPEIYDKLDDDIKKLLIPHVSSNILSETVAKIVSRLMRNISGDDKIKNLSPDKIALLKKSLTQALSTPGLINELVDDNDPQIVHLRVTLAESMRNEILSCIQGNTFDPEDIKIATQETLMLWKGKRISDSKTQKDAADQQKSAIALAQTNAEAARARAAAEARISERLYSTPTAQQTFYAPRGNRAADNMNALANVVNSFANFEEGFAANVNAFQGPSSN
jgi:hypothetical protein